ncbi:HIRAN domain-containing protein [Chelativorans sp.]|uniref:HIRAN domain-containing protein n=1 Tax=Chelativorans sp. TaxID=2203393 RepID=UPI002811EE0E|nr:HIRAN domain-containing protein [Chelativorans sp.]
MGLLNWIFGARLRRLPSGKFGQDRYKPDGKWVQTTTAVKVVGLQHRQDAVRSFVMAVALAEGEGQRYGVRLRPDPANPHDKNAIAVDGYVSMDRWHIGFLDRVTAKELHRDLISVGIPIEAELYSLWRGDDGYIDVNLIVLAPPGHSMKKRLRG